MEVTLFDPPVPYRGGNETQQAAAEFIKPFAPKLRERVYAFIASCKEGATNEEISQYTGIKLSSVCGRVAELRAEGAIAHSGKTRPGSSGVAAKIWKAAN